MLAAEFVARLARVLDRVDPGALRLHEGGNAIAASRSSGAWKLVLAGNLQHRIPVHARIKARGFGRRRRYFRSQVQGLAGLAVDALGINQAVAAHPDLVFCLGQIGHHVAALIVGRHDLGEFGWQVRRLGNDPDARLGSAGAGDHAADIRRAESRRLRKSRNGRRAEQRSESQRWQ